MDKEVNELTADRSRWLVVYTKVDREFPAKSQLEQQKYEVFLPVCRLASARFLDTPLLRPLFPRYLFVKVVPPQRWTPISNTRGVDYILRQGPERLAEVPEDVVSTIRQRMERDGGAVTITELEQGSKVRITGGLFQDVEALYLRSGRDRVTVLLNILGRATEVAVPRKMVAGRR